jgi:hypothetical protein
MAFAYPLSPLVQNLLNSPVESRDRKARGECTSGELFLTACA